jgi:hypothetical protein
MTTGKYDAVLQGLSKLPPADLNYQQKIEQAKEQVPTREAVALAEHYANLRLQKAEAEAALSAVNLQIAAYEQLLAESQEAGAAGWGAYGVKENALRLASGDTIRVQPEPSGKVVDKEAFRQWCIENGYANQLQLWPSTMNAIVKERLLQGDPGPEGTEVFLYTKVVFVKKGKETL